MTRYTLEESGTHSEELAGGISNGLHDLILGDVDALISAGMSPARILATLRERYILQNDTTLLSLLPNNHAKIKNRVATLVKRTKAGLKRKVDNMEMAGSPAADESVDGGDYGVLSVLAFAEDAISSALALASSASVLSDISNGREEGRDFSEGKLAKRKYCSQHWNGSLSLGVADNDVDFSERIIFL